MGSVITSKPDDSTIVIRKMYVGRVYVSKSSLEGIEDVYYIDFDDISAENLLHDFEGRNVKLIIEEIK